MDLEVDEYVRRECDSGRHDYVVRDLLKAASNPFSDPCSVVDGVLALKCYSSRVKSWNRFVELIASSLEEPYCNTLRTLGHE